MHNNQTLITAPSLALTTDSTIAIWEPEGQTSHNRSDTVSSLSHEDSGHEK
jgi:hypothetical protein